MQSQLALVEIEITPFSFRLYLNIYAHRQLCEMISRIFFNLNSFSNLCSVAGGKFAFLLETCCTLDSRHVVKHGKMASFHYHSRDIPMPA